MFKIDCDALSDDEVETLAWLLSKRLPSFSSVEGVPQGGLRLATAMGKFAAKEGPLLIVDDVFTTGGSMEEHRAGRYNVIGAVLFARGPCPFWIKPLFSMDLLPKDCLD
ncbi:MAG TPA: phosphoribosyltransferase [Nitrososphaera sp.]|nr:phosphoribosyltransferase [Nitrososphaera sp.]